MSVYLAEMVGTMILIVFGDGVVANVLLKKSKGQESGWIVIATGWGLAVALAVYTVGRVSGAHINPAVTLSLACVGAFLGGVLVWLSYLPHWAETEDKTAKLVVFSTVPAIRNTTGNILAEVIGTAVLVFCILAIGANAQGLTKPGEIDLSVAFSKGLQPFLVGVLVWGIGLTVGFRSLPRSPAARQAPSSSAPRDCERGRTWTSPIPVVI